MARPKKEANDNNETEVLDKAAIRKKALAELNKKHGKGTISSYSDWDMGEAISCIPSGSIDLDKALGRGGYPRGRIIELWGEESSGKSTLALQAVAQCQKLGGAVAYLDLENAIDPEYALKLGVDMDSVDFSQPDHGEQAFDIVEALLKTNAYDFIVVDSVAALVPQKELEGEMGSSQMGSQARLMSQGLRKIAGPANRSKCVVFFINQTRSKIGVMYGDPTTTTGGNALKFYASIRMRITKGKPILNGDVVVGNFTKVKVVKNKVAPPFRTAEFSMLHGVGVDRIGEVLDFGVRYNIVEKSGGSHTFKGVSLGRSREKSLAAIKENPALQQELETLVYSALNNGTAVAEAVPPEDVEYDEDGEVVAAEEDEE